MFVAISMIELVSCRRPNVPDVYYYDFFGRLRENLNSKQWSPTNERCQSVDRVLNVFNPVVLYN